MSRLWFSQAQREALPDAGVYLVRRRDGSVIYVGQTGNTPQRVANLQAQTWWIHEAASFEVVYECRHERLRRVVEALYIAVHQPVWNCAGRFETRRRVRDEQHAHRLALADAGYAQPTALGAAILALLAVLIGFTTAPGQALAFVVLAAVGRLLFLVGRGVYDADRAREWDVEVYPAPSRAEAARAIDGWYR